MSVMSYVIFYYNFPCFTAEVGEGKALAAPGPILSRVLVQTNVPSKTTSSVAKIRYIILCRLCHVALLLFSSSTEGLYNKKRIIHKRLYVCIYIYTYIL